MLNRIVNALGTGLVLVGIGILVYVGVSYAQETHPSGHIQTWSKAQRQAAKQLSSRLTHQPRVTVPRTVQSKRLPAPGSESAVRMIIPKIDVNAPVVQTPPVNGVWAVADWAVGHLSTTANPGGPGNGAYSAHDDIKGELFKRIDQLVPGNVIVLRTAHASYTYIVTGQQVVDPSNVGVLAPTANPTITLIGCTPYWVDTQRMIIKATLKSSAAL